jgi:hypothetical protein
MLYLLGGRSVEMGGGEMGWPLCIKLALTTRHLCWIEVELYLVFWNI